MGCRQVKQGVKMKPQKESMRISADGKKFYEGLPLKCLSFIVNNGRKLIEYTLTHRDGKLSINKIREIKLET